MALGICTICSEQQSKYKCPRCSVRYCSLTCFRSPKHQHEQDQSQETPQKPQTSLNEEKVPDFKYSEILKDEKLKYLLRFKSLQVHLRSIYEILCDETKTTEERKDLANYKLTSLRSTGDEENELVEEFCQQVQQLLHSK